MWLKRSSYEKDLNILADHKLNMRQQDEETANATLTAFQGPDQGNNSPLEICISDTGHHKIFMEP